MWFLLVEKFIGFKTILSGIKFTVFCFLSHCESAIEIIQQIFKFCILYFSVLKFPLVLSNNSYFSAEKFYFLFIPNVFFLTWWSMVIIASLKSLSGNSNTWATLRLVSIFFPLESWPCFPGTLYVGWFWIVPDTLLYRLWVLYIILWKSWCFCFSRQSTQVQAVSSVLPSVHSGSNLSSVL